MALYYGRLARPFSNQAFLEAVWTQQIIIILVNIIILIFSLHPRNSARTTPRCRLSLGKGAEYFRRVALVPSQLIDFLLKILLHLIRPWLLLCFFVELYF